jgi:tRNA (guanine9-N1)-methyltransferase
VYLTAESTNVLQTLDDDTVYVIGGLVDHNRLKGVCHERAVERGIATAQLPIAEYLAMSSRKVLTVNHVFEILIRFRDSGDWLTTLQKVIPARKGAAVKDEKDQESVQASSPAAVEEQPTASSKEEVQDTHASGT